MVLPKNSKYIGSYDPIDVSSQPILSKTMHLNLQSVAKVCYTDLISVDLIIREIMSQIKEFAMRGANLRILFSVGKLVSKAG